MIHWIYLFAAIVCEIAGTISMKFSAGFTKFLPSVLIFIFYATAFIFITLAIRKIEISVAYTIWAGLGTALIAAIGILYFGEQVGVVKLASIALILIGVIGLKLSSSS